MAWGARQGLKQWGTSLVVETFKKAKWPGEPVRDSYENPGERGKAGKRGNSLGQPCGGWGKRQVQRKEREGIRRVVRSEQIW